jgi:N-acetylglucosaminyldiphosphoundecaprenol N-acetyl-beta-D-mannosaminyltransferase
MNILSKVSCLGYEVFTDTLDKVPKDKKIVVNTINQYSYCIAEKDKQFKKSLQESDILLPDGIGIVVAVKWLLGKKIKKIAGADIHEFLLHRLNKDHGSCFYMGASKATLKKIEARIAKDYPNVKVGSYSPPFKKVFSKEENATIIKEVNTFKPDVLFVGMTAPKQEKWSIKHKEALNVNGPICAIGAVFDFYAGTVKRPNKTLQNMGLEWFGRLLKEPKRMWRRYIYYGVIFSGYLIKAKLRPSYTA